MSDGGGSSEAKFRSKISVDLDCVSIALQNVDEEEHALVDRCGTLMERERIPHPLLSADFVNKWSVEGEEVKEDDLEESFAHRHTHTDSRRTQTAVHA